MSVGIEMNIPLYSLGNFLHQRMDAHAQWEVRNVANDLYKQLESNEKTMGIFSKMLS